MSALPCITTAEALLHAGDIGPCELVRGELIMMSPAGFRHGLVVAVLTEYLGRHCRENDLGAVCGAETGFILSRDPDTVRAPDVAFVGKDRLDVTAGRGFGRAAPDLAVEVLSPEDRPGPVEAKTRNWLDAGCRAVWVVDPERRTVQVRSGRAGEDPQDLTLTEGATLDGADVVPGFSLPGAEIFRTLPADG